MAMQVPQLEPGSVQNNNLPDVRIPNQSQAGDFGGDQTGLFAAMNKDLGDVGDAGAYMSKVQQYQQEAAQRLQQIAQQKATQAAVVTGSNQIQSVSDNLLNDPNTGALNMKGSNAIGITPKVMQQFQDQSQDIISKADPSAVPGLTKEFQQQYVGMNKRLQVHESTEAASFHNDQNQTYIGNNVQNAVTNYDDDDAFNTAKKNITNTITQTGQTNGVDPATTQAAIADQISKIQMGRLNQYLSNGQTAQAKQFFEDNKNDFSATPGASGKSVQTQAQDAVTDGSNQGQAQSIADKLMAKNLDLSTGYAQIKDMNLDPDVRAATEKRFDQLMTVQQKSQKVNQDAIFTQGSSTLQAVHDQQVKSGQTPNVDTMAIPRDQWNAMSDQEQALLESKAKRLTEGTEPPSDPKAYTKYLGMKRADLAQVSEADMDKLSESMSPQQFNKVSSLWHSARQSQSGDTNALAKYHGMISDNEAVTNSLISTGQASPGDTMAAINKDSSKAKAWNDRQNEISKAYDAFAQDNGKPPTYFDKQKINDQITLKNTPVNYTTPGRFWGTNSATTTVGAITPDEIKTAYIPIEKISDADKAKAQTAISSYGGSVSDDKIEKLWGAFKAGADKKTLQSIATGK